MQPSSGFLQHRALGEHESMLRNSGFDCDREFLGRAGLGEQSEYLALVHRAHRFVAIGVSGEQDSRHVGPTRQRLVKEFGAVHAGHAHVRDHHRQIVDRAQLLQRVFGGGCDVHVEALAQH